MDNYWHWLTSVVASVVKQSQEPGQSKWRLPGRFILWNDGSMSLHSKFKFARSCDRLPALHNLEFES